jgi:hypothetical protein
LARIIADSPLWGWAGIWWPSSPVAVATNLATCQSEVPAVCAPLLLETSHPAPPVQPVLSHHHQDNNTLGKIYCLTLIVVRNFINRRHHNPCLAALLQVSFLEEQKANDSWKTQDQSQMLNPPHL